MPFVNYPSKTQLGLGKDAICTSCLEEFGILEVMGRCHSVTESMALNPREPLRGVMENHQLFGHRSEQITREKAKRLGASYLASGRRASTTLNAIVLVEEKCQIGNRVTGKMPLSIVRLPTVASNDVTELADAWRDIAEARQVAKQESTCRVKRA